MRPSRSRRARRLVLRLGLAGALALVPTLGALASLGACTSYDPSLPDEPFLCGAQEPRCPDGYTCVARPPDAMVCRKDGDGEAPVDAAVADAAR
jgi:hypothetical protein